MDPRFICGFAISPIDGTRASEDDVSHLVVTGDIFRYFPPQVLVAQVEIQAQIGTEKNMSRIKAARNKLGTLNHGHAGHTGPALRAPFDSVSTCDCIQVKRMGEEGGEEAKAVS